MSGNALAQTALLLGLLLALAAPLGGWLANVATGAPRWSDRLFGPLCRGLYRLAGVREDEEMGWRRYATALLGLQLVGVLFVFGLQRLQALLPLNPAKLPGVDPGVAFNTAISFATNTNWQAYGGETTMSHLTQLVGLTPQNFLSAAIGLAVLFALVRGLTRREASGLGSFWVDLTRATVEVLLPLSLVLALALVSQGVVQTLNAREELAGIDAPAVAGGVAVPPAAIAVGPAASQVAIKQLGTNGGGFFNVNSAHPLENPTPLSNLLQLLSILLLPAAACFAFGALVQDRRQGLALLATMLVLFVPIALATVAIEAGQNPRLAALGADGAPSALQAGGNLEGKELRFGATNSALWAVATTAASSGSVNSMHDSYLPLGGLGPMWLMQLGEVVFGGVGSGLYGLLLYAIVAVFVAGLLVGRTPAYLGKKLEAFEVKMAALGLLLPSAATLVGTAIACVVPEGSSALANPGAHGFSELLYAFSSGANNNGSAFGGLTVNGTFFAIAIGLAMAIGRFGVIIPVLALAGSLAKKRVVASGPGTLPTHGPLFVALLVGTIVLVGALTFVPSLALGPVVEHLQLFGG